MLPPSFSQRSRQDLGGNERVSLKKRWDTGLCFVELMVLIRLTKGGGLMFADGRVASLKIWRESLVRIFRVLFEKAPCPRTNAGVTERPQVAHAVLKSGRVTGSLRFPCSVRVTGRINIGTGKRFACSSTSNIRSFARFASSMVEAGSARIECRCQVLALSAAFSTRIALASWRELAGVARKTVMVSFG